MRFSYQAEKLSQARSCLMLPHPQGEEISIADAFHACSLGFKDIESPANVERLDDNAKDWISVIRSMMNTDGLSDSSGHGLWVEKAKRLTEDDRAQLSRCIDELANWFNSED